MNKNTIDVIDHNLHASFTDKEHTFPQHVKNLGENGIERYYADLVGLQITFYATDGSTYTAPMPYQNRPKRGSHFSEKEIIEALRAIQNGEIVYPEFLNRIIKAGTVNYTVFLLGKRAHYTGAKGEIHIEHFPQKQ